MRKGVVPSIPQSRWCDCYNKSKPPRANLKSHLRARCAGALQFHSLRTPSPLLPSSHRAVSRPVDGPGTVGQTVILFSKCNPTSVNMCMSDHKHCSTICLRARRFAAPLSLSVSLVPSWRHPLCHLTAFSFSRVQYLLQEGRRPPARNYISFDTCISAYI